MDMWDRQRDHETGELEPNLWYSRFVDYRLQGPDRTLLGAVNRWRAKVGKNRQNSIPGAWSRNAKRWRWRARAEAWDAECCRERIAAAEKARAEMIEHHIKLGRSLQQVGAKRLLQLGKAPESLTAGEARQFIKAGVAIERQARGLPEYLLEIAAMTEAELRERYAALVGAITQTDANED